LVIFTARCRKIINSHNVCTHQVDIRNNNLTIQVDIIKIYADVGGIVSRNDYTSSGFRRPKLKILWMMDWRAAAANPLYYYYYYY
jgi:hypothetical protein